MITVKQFYSKNMQLAQSYMHGPKTGETMPRQSTGDFKGNNCDYSNKNLGKKYEFFLKDKMTGPLL